MKDEEHDRVVQQVKQMVQDHWLPVTLGSLGWLLSLLALRSLPSSFVLPNSLAWGIGGLGGWAIALVVYLSQRLAKQTHQIAELRQVLQIVGDQPQNSAELPESGCLGDAQRYQSWMDHLNAGFVIHGADTRIVFCNRTACELLGLSLDQMLGKTAIDPSWQFLREDGTPLPPSDYPINQVLATGLPVQHYVVGIQQGGQLRFWALVNGIPEFDHQGHLQQVMITFIDITRLKQAEADLREMSQVMENALSGISRLDAQGHYCYVNTTYADLVGYRPEEMLGMSWQQTVHPSELERTQLAYQQMVETGRVDIEIQGIRRDGSSLFKQLVMIASYDSQQRLLGHYCFMKDVSDRQRHEAERREAEAALQLSQARFAGILEIAGDAIISINAAQQITLFNQGAEQVFGYKEAEVLGQPLSLLLPHRAATAHNQHVQQFGQSAGMARRMGQRGEIYGRRKDGSEFPAEASISRLQLGDETIFTAFLRDVSDRKQAEANLRQSESTKQAIIQAIPDLLMRMQADGNALEFISNSQFNLVEPQHLEPTTNVYEVLPSHLAELRLHYTKEALRSGTTQIYEQQVVAQSGLRYEEVRIVPLPQNEVLVMVRDITDRKQTEEALRHQKEMFQAIVNYSPMMTVLFNAHDDIQFVNPEVERILGWSLDAWQHQDVFLSCYPDPSYRQRVINHLFAANGKWQDFMTLTASGDTIVTSWATVRLSSGSFLGIGQDISERKQKEQALRRAMEAAEAANLAKSTFLATMSHELRTPLNVILGFAQVMGHDPALTPNQQQDLFTIQRSGDHLLRLINDVLDLSKIEAGHCVLEETAFDLIALLHNLRTMMSERIRAKHLQLELNIAPEVPQFVIADEQKLRQVLLNLLSNSIKFTQQGSITLDVAHQGSMVPLTFLQFEVTDTGVGIAAEELNSIFDAFMQAEAGRKSINGTGLGLTISRKLLELMGGGISVRSILGQGSTFTVIVPVRPTTAAQEQPARSDRPVLGLLPNHPTRRILVVDDQSENRLLLIRILTQLGLEVREATNGEEAVQLWQEWQPDLTWMDIRMPGMDGYEATRKIRALEQEPLSIIIALTAQASHSDRTLALAAGCNDYLSKPFRVETLLLKMQEYLDLEYLYGDADPVLPDQNHQDSEFSSAVALPLPTDCLTSVPEDWLGALEGAAVCGDDRAIATLAAQLPPALAPLRAYLTDLAEHYQFEQILQLLHHQLAVNRSDSN